MSVVLQELIAGTRRVQQLHPNKLNDDVSNLKHVNILYSVHTPAHTVLKGELHPNRSAPIHFLSDYFICYQDKIVL